MSLFSGLLKYQIDAIRLLITAPRDMRGDLQEPPYPQTTLRLIALQSSGVISYRLSSNHEVCIFGTFRTEYDGVDSGLIVKILTGLTLKWCTGGEMNGYSARLASCRGTPDNMFLVVHAMELLYSSSIRVRNFFSLDRAWSLEAL